VKQKDALAKKIVALLPDHETLTLSQFLKLTQGKPSTVKLRLKELESLSSSTERYEACLDALREVAQLKIPSPAAASRKDCWCNHPSE
jgi:Tfp pilus assembly protein PilN